MMKIKYDKTLDILCIEFSDDAIIKDVSHGWNVNIGYGANGIAELTILEAKERGYWPLENAKELIAVTA